MKVKTPPHQTALREIISFIKSTYPTVKLEASESFRWAPEEGKIYFNPESKNALLSLLHETGHMLCGHKNYYSDIGLLRMEVAAWEKAKLLAVDLGLKIDEDHIEKCLDSYRDWIYRRSSCPLCTQAGIEQKVGVYTCINCQNKWQVSKSRFCRVYRKTLSN